MVQLVPVIGGERMKWYRMYFYGASGSFQGRHEFEAQDDLAAMTVAEHLCDACSDRCETFQLWDGVRCVDVSFSRMPHPAVPLDQISLSFQKSMIESEETIRHSDWAIARSKRLVERINLLIVRRGFKETGAEDISGDRKDGNIPSTVEIPES